MKLRTVAAVAGMILGLVAGTAQANTIVDVNGSIQGHTFSAVLNLNVQGNTAVSGTGTFTGYGLLNNDLSLITETTPYNEPSVYGPIGFRGNDGTDFLGSDQVYPIDTSGLLFDIGTPPAPNAFPLFAVYMNTDGTYGAGFTGNVGGNEYYAQFSGTADVVSVMQVSAVPLPASAPMFGAALLGLAGLGYAAKRKKAASAA